MSIKTNDKKLKWALDSACHALIIAHALKMHID